MTVTPRTYGSGPSEIEMLAHTAKGSQLIHAGMNALDARGWCQGGIANNSGEVCGHGGIEAAAETEVATIPPSIYRYKERLVEDMGVYTGPGGLANPFRFDMRTERVDNPEYKAFQMARHAAHWGLMSVAEKHGWEAQEQVHKEGARCGQFTNAFSPFPARCTDECTPYKDAFAVFNDDPGTTIEDVALMMKEAAVFLESLGQ